MNFNTKLNWRQNQHTMLQPPPQGGIYLYRFLLCQRRYCFVSCRSIFQNLQIYHLKTCVTTLPLRENPEWKLLHSWHRFLSSLFWRRKCDSLSLKEILQSLLVQNSCHKISTKKLKIWKGNADRDKHGEGWHTFPERLPAQVSLWLTGESTGPIVHELLGML